MRKPFILTYVTYDKDDEIGCVLALMSLVPIFLVVSFVTVIAVRRDFQTIFSFCGLLISLGLTYVLKRELAHPRPLRSDLDDYGMPSSHTVFMFHVATYYSLQLLFRSWRLPVMYRLYYSVGLFGIVAAVAYSRVYLHYHTAAQVWVGMAVGVTTGTIWHVVCVHSSRIIAKIFCSGDIGRWLLLRDYSSIGYSAIEEYEVMLLSGRMSNELSKKDFD